MDYTIAKFIHVVLAIVAVGMNASYGVWIARARRDPQHIGFAMRTVKLIDDRIANPAYALLLVTGLFMVWTAGIPLTTLWIALALVLYAAVVVLGFAVVTPNFREQIRALETEGPESESFRRAAARGRLWGMVAVAAVLAILFLMVVKPTAG